MGTMRACEDGTKEPTLGKKYTFVCRLTGRYFEDYPVLFIKSTRPNFKCYLSRIKFVVALRKIVPDHTNLFRPKPLICFSEIARIRRTGTHLSERIHE